MQLLLCLLSLGMSKAYQLCVVGATSGLGRELVYQAALDKNMSVLALSGKSGPVPIPCRVDSFQELRTRPPFVNPNMDRGNYWEDIRQYDYETVVFTTGAEPFKKDYSDTLMAKVMTHLPESCKHVVLVSAHGVGDSLIPNEIGINVMDSWYLKDVYRAKNEQEQMLGLDMFKTKHPYLKTSVFRPKALSFGKTMLPSVSRQQLASDILDCVEKID
jgi:hypothetical protein|tara:strand:+ start:2201 stop:2848 length:648 start_codon:yes stop_codon:yes gene_type:complete